MGKIACQTSDLSKHNTVELNGFANKTLDIQAKLAAFEGQVAD